MKQRVLDTHFGHLINLKLKRFSEKGIENILLAAMFNPLFFFLFFFFFYWAKLTATRVKFLVTDKFTFVKTQSLKDPYPWSIFICNSVFPPDKGVCSKACNSIKAFCVYSSTTPLQYLHSSSSSSSSSSFFPLRVGVSILLFLAVTLLNKAYMR